MTHRESAFTCLLVVIALLMWPSLACAQAFDASGTSPTEINPLSLLESASQMLPPVPTPDGTVAPNGLSTSLNIVLLLTVLSLAPALLVMCTCFTRIIVVLGLLRQALGTQNLPPGQVITGLALFMTFVVMAPTVEAMYRQGIGPYVRGEQRDYNVAWDQSKQPLRDFMFAQIEATGNWSGVYMMLNYRGIDTSQPEKLTRADVDMISLIPAYILSELKTAFLIGFRIYLPFLVIDMVISSMLISMGMLMLPPVLISLPFKLLLFVLVDGWQLVVGSLMNGFVQPDSVLQFASAISGGGGPP